MPAKENNGTPVTKFASIDSFRVDQITISGLVNGTVQAYLVPPHTGPTTLIPASDLAIGYIQRGDTRTDFDSIRTIIMTNGNKYVAELATEVDAAISEGRWKPLTPGATQT